MAHTCEGLHTVKLIFRQRVHCYIQHMDNQIKYWIKKEFPSPCIVIDDSVILAQTTLGVAYPFKQIGDTIVDWRHQRLFFKILHYFHELSTSRKTVNEGLCTESVLLLFFFFF